MTAGPHQVLIGLDAGTTSVKAVAFGVGSSWQRVALREYPLLEPAPGEAVQEPETILTAVHEALAECAAACGSAEVLAISVSAGMHGLMALDSELLPLTPLVTWADARAEEEARELRRSGQAAELHGLTGAPVHPMTPLTKLRWFAAHEPDTWARARWWVGLKEVVLRRLTGRLVTELSSASGTGLLDLATRTWSGPALAAAGVDADRLPPIVPTTAVLPLAREPARRAGLPPGTPVVAGGGDGPLGNLGTGALAPGVAALNLGTSGAVRTTIGAPRVDDARTLFCYALTEDAWVVGGAISNGGVAVRWAGETLAADVRESAGEGADAAVLALAARAPAGCDGLVMLPYLLAERAPLWELDIPGAYLGVRREHGRAHLLRATLEGVCLQTRLILDRLDGVAPVREVHATGGVFRGDLWREVMAAMLARPLYLAGDAQGTALGAAALGLLALGRAPTLADAVTRFADPDAAPAAPVEPDPRLVAVYDSLRASLPGLADAVDRVASLLAPSRSPRTASGTEREPTGYAGAHRP